MDINNTPTSSFLAVKKYNKQKANDADTFLKFGNKLAAGGGFLSAVAKEEGITVDSNQYLANGHTIVYQDQNSKKVHIMDITSGAEEVQSAAEFAAEFSGVNASDIKFGSDEIYSVSNPAGFKAGTQGNGKVGISAEDIKDLVKSGASLDKVKEYLVGKFGGSEDAVAKSVLGASYDLVPTDKQASLFNTIAQKLTAQIEQTGCKNQTSGDIAITSYSAVSLDLIDRTNKNTILNSMRDLFGDNCKNARFDTDNGNAIIKTASGIKIINSGDLSVKTATASDLQKYFPGVSPLDINKIQFTDGNPQLTYNNTSTTNVNSTGVGDPHYQINGVQAFDHQQQGIYTLLDGDDVAFYSVYKECYSGEGVGSRVSGAEIINIKNSNINVVTTADGNVKVMNGDTELTGDALEQAKKQYNISINKNGSDVVIKVGDRTITETCYGGSMNFAIGSFKTNDSGMALEEMAGADEADGKLDGWVDLNKDGVQEANEVYNTSATTAVHSNGSAMAAPVNADQAQSFIDKYKQFGLGSLNAVMLDSGVLDANGNVTAESANDPQALKDARAAYKAVTSNNPNALDAVKKWIASSIAAIQNDYSANSSTQGFKSNQGYSASQWNELLLTAKYAVNKDQLNSIMGAVNSLKGISGLNIQQGIDNANAPRKVQIKVPTASILGGQKATSLSFLG